MTNDKEMYKGEQGYTKGFIRVVRNIIQLLPKISHKTHTMKISDIFRPRAPRHIAITAEVVPVQDRIKHGPGYIMSTDESTGEMTPKKRLNYDPPATRTSSTVATDGSTTVWLLDTQIG